MPGLSCDGNDEIMSKKFEGSERYIATDDLMIAVNASIHLERPLLVKGEPGCGKTELAKEIASSLELPFVEWHIKSTTKAQQGLYEYDAVARLRDSQLGHESVNEIGNYIRRGPVWEAFEHDNGCVLLIDEIDKADIEFPNDLLRELDHMEFSVYETGTTVCAKKRPIVMITSNNEKELPDAFLRRCFFHFIPFPDSQTMHAIADVHFPGLDQELIKKGIEVFYGIREISGLRKRPSTSELLDWLRVLSSETDPLLALEGVAGGENSPPFAGALLKNEQDMETLSRSFRRPSERR